MKLKTIALLLWVWLPTYLEAQTCAYCQYVVLTDRYKCVNSCTYAGEGCGGTCCRLLENHQVCYVGSCCTIALGIGLCYDQSGDSCENFPRLIGTSPVNNSAMPPKALPASDSKSEFVRLQLTAQKRTPLKSVRWISSKTFADTIGRHSKSFQKAVAAFQLIVNQSQANPTIPEFGNRKFQIVLRPGLPATVIVSHAGEDNWAISLNPGDTESEGAHAPVLLEITGANWKLVSSWDETTKQKLVVASGTVE